MWPGYSSVLAARRKEDLEVSAWSERMQTVSSETFSRSLIFYFIFIFKSINVCLGACCPM